MLQFTQKGNKYFEFLLPETQLWCAQIHKCICWWRSESR